ncbi:MAG: pullulanase-associated domain-containing protein [Candidatus Izemoplasma sp.]
MKRIMQVVLTLTLALTVFAVANEQVAAATTCPTGNELIIHYQRWDANYTDTYLHVWGTGTDGTSDGVALTGEDEFGGYYSLCIGDDAETMGLINKYTAAWGDGMTDRDGVDTDENGTLDGNHKELVLGDGTDLEGFDVDGMRHVYIYEGSNGIISETDPNSLPMSPLVATIAVIYFDAAQSFDAWNIWTWGTGTLGTQLTSEFYSGSGVPFVSSLGVDGGIVEDFRVAFINVDPADMDAEIGFIVRTDAWEKKDGDLFISTDGLVAGDVKTVFYIAGSGMFYDNFADFEAEAHKFELSVAKALNPLAVNVEFNKDVIIEVDDEIVFDASFFRVFNKNHEEIVISTVNYDSTLIATKQFTVVFEENLDADMGPYVIKYNDGMGLYDAWVIDFDTTAPEIRIVGSTEVTLELGDTYALPSFSAYDVVGDESIPVYNVHIVDGKGTVDTRNAGVYEIVIEAVDAFGNVAQETITVTVIDICAVDTTATDSANPVSLIALLAGLPLVAGAFITFKRN